MSNDKNPFKSTVDPDKDQEIRYVPVEYIYTEESKEDEVDLLHLIEDVWNGRKILLISVIVFTVWGLFHYLFGPKNYESESILIQESRTEGGQAQQLLQSLGGGNFGFGSNERGVLPPNLYPRIVESVDFQYDLIFEELEFAQFQERLTLFDYFTIYYEPSFREKTYRFLTDYTIKLPATLYRGVSSIFSTESGAQASELSYRDEEVEIRSLTREERAVLREMRGRILIELDGNLISVKTRIPDAEAAANLNVLLVERIQEFVIAYRVEKARQNLEFTEDQLSEARARYELAQQALAQFSDSNINIATAEARTQLEYLQNQRNLTFNIYQSISQQVERARLTLQEETPVFSTLQKSNLPSSPIAGSVLIVIIFITCGMVIGCVLIFLIKIYNRIYFSIIMGSNDKK